jgi:fucose permease
MSLDAEIAPAKPEKKSNRLALTVVTSLFFGWGFVTALNDILVPHLKAIFDLNYAKVMLPVLQGLLADGIGIHHAFMIPAICYVYIVYYAFWGSRPASGVQLQA